MRKTPSKYKEVLYWLLLARFPTEIGFRLRNSYFSSILGACGEECTFACNVKVLSPERVFLGKRVGIANDVINDVIIDGRGAVRIGSNTIVGFRSVVLTSTHNFDRTDIPVKDQRMSCAQVIIGFNVWIGANVYILPGVTIGDGAVVGACAAVTRDLPSNPISAGIPAKVIRMRG